MSKVIKSVIKNLSTKKCPGLDDLTGDNFQQTFKEELMLILLKLVQESEEEGTLSNSFHNVSITLTWNPDKNTAR